MDYLTKYNKYSNKLINFNNNKFKGGNLKRIRKEIETMQTLGYENFKLDEETYILTFTRTIDNSKFIVQFSKRYPFKGAIINNKNYMESWNPAKTIHSTIESDKINEYKETTKKVLIYCHPRIVTGSFEPLVIENHWYGTTPSIDDNIFKLLFTKYNLKGEAIFETVDINSGGTYQADGFSDEFIELNKGKYDLILVPDCAGIWYKLQKDGEYDMRFNKIKDYTQEEQNINKTLLITTSLKLTTMLKDKGIISFGKFMSETPCNIKGTEFSTLSAAFESNLKENGFETHVIDTDFAGKFITAQKKS